MYISYVFSGTIGSMHPDVARGLVLVYPENTLRSPLAICRSL